MIVTGPRQHENEQLNARPPTANGGLLCSVVIPWHRDHDDLDRAVDSVLAQDHQSFEIVIVVNGVPASETDVIARRIADKRVRVLYNAEPNASAARNIGFAAAAGVLVFFLDADDVFLPAKLSTVCRAFNSEPFDVAFSRGLRVRDEQVRWAFPIALWDGSQHISEFFFCGGHTISASALVVAKSRCGDILFDKTLQPYEDPGLVLAAVEQGLSVRMLPDVLFEWNDRESENRLSQMTNYDERLQTANRLRDVMTGRAVHAFRARCVAQHMFPNRFWQSLAIFHKALLHRAVPAFELMLFCVRGLIPAGIRRTLLDRYFRAKSDRAHRSA